MPKLAATPGLLVPVYPFPGSTASLSQFPRPLLVPQDPVFLSLLSIFSIPTLRTA